MTMCQLNLGNIELIFHSNCKDNENLINTKCSIQHRLSVLIHQIYVQVYRHIVMALKLENINIIDRPLKATKIIFHSVSLKRWQDIKSTCVIDKIKYNLVQLLII